MTVNKVIQLDKIVGMEPQCIAHRWAARCIEGDVNVVIRYSTHKTITLWFIGDQVHIIAPRMRSVVALYKFMRGCEQRGCANWVREQLDGKV